MFGFCPQILDFDSRIQPQYLHTRVFLPEERRGVRFTFFLLPPPMRAVFFRLDRVMGLNICSTQVRFLRKTTLWRPS